jgi:hypothetical protein
MTGGARDSGGAEGRFIGGRVARLQEQQREPLVLSQKVAVIGAEQNREAVIAKSVGLGQRQQLDEETGKLDDMVMRTPGMAIARADLKTETAIERGGCVEIAHRMDDVIEAAGHNRPSAVIIRESG